MLIGEIVRQTGISRDTIRYYERLGLLQAEGRPSRFNNYKAYPAATVGRLGLIQCAKKPRFRLVEIVELHTLWESQQLPAADLEARATEKLAAIAEKIRQLEVMRTNLLGGLAGAPTPAIPRQRNSQWFTRIAPNVGITYHAIRPQNYPAGVRKPATGGLGVPLLCVRPPPEPPLSAALQAGTLRVAGHLRSYDQYVPAHLPVGAPLVLHGSNMDGTTRFTPALRAAFHTRRVPSTAGFGCSFSSLGAVKKTGEATWITYRQACTASSQLASLVKSASINARLSKEIIPPVFSVSSTLLRLLNERRVVFMR